MVKFDAGRRLSASVLAALLIFALGGCAPRVSAVDVVGRWVHQGPKNAIAEITFATDGNASGDGLPQAALFGFGTLTWDHAYAFKGRWELRNNNRVMLYLSEVTVDGLTKRSASSTYFSVSRDSNGVSISTPIGDPDNEDTFRFEPR